MTERVEPLVIDTPEPPADEALIQVEACGMCGDLGIFAGLHPRTKVPFTR